MLIPLRWLEKYIKLKHPDEEFGKILTKLDSMQDGPIKIVNDLPIIDLEVRQNRPDLLSIIGIAREYAAYIDEQVNYPPILSDTEIQVEWGTPKDNLEVKTKNIVKRFVTVEIKNIKITKSPKWMKTELESYGIPSINNIVDITNYVMLEYGMPLHAFDKDKLIKSKNAPLLTLRRGIEDEKFTTWQGTKLKLTTDDIVVADAKRPVAIAGVIGGSNSGIDKKTKSIILESATYDHASIRRTALKHNVITDASLRHSKFLNPEMSKLAIQRALYLIKELTGGEITKIEDYYNEKDKEAFSNRTIDFNINQINRLVGVQLETEKVIKYLNQLGFGVIEQKDAIGLNKHILIIKIPPWRTDISYEEDIVEEIIRLWDYDNIPLKQINMAPGDFNTPNILILEEKIKDILVNLGYDEQITIPLCKYRNKTIDNKYKQIKLENSLTSELDGLRTSINDTLENSLIHSKKNKNTHIKIFESGKIYWEHKIGDYKEERRIATLTDGYDFSEIKANILTLFSKLGINPEEILKNDTIIFKIEKSIIAKLKKSGFNLYLENIENFVRTDLVPFIKIETEITQKIVEEISFEVKETTQIGRITKDIKEISEFIDTVYYIRNDKKGIENLEITFASKDNNLTRDIVNKIMKDIKKSLKKVKVR